MAIPKGGFQPRNTPAERRAFFELERQLREIPAANVVFDPPVSGVTADPPTVQATFQEFANNYMIDMPQRFLPTAGTGMDISDLEVVTEHCRLLLTFSRSARIFGAIRNSTGAALSVGSIIATVPAGARPSSTRRIIGVNANTGASLAVNVNPSGTIEVRNGATAVLDTHIITLAGGWPVAS